MVIPPCIWRLVRALPVGQCLTVGQWSHLDCLCFLTGGSKPGLVLGPLLSPSSVCDRCIWFESIFHVVSWCLVTPKWISCVKCAPDKRHPSLSDVGKLCCCLPVAWPVLFC